MINKLLFLLGIIDIARTQLWGEGGSAKCLQMRARGEVGVLALYVYARILALQFRVVLMEGLYDLKSKF